MCIAYICPQLPDVLFSSMLTPAIKGKSIFLQRPLYCSYNKTKLTFRLACILNTAVSCSITEISVACKCFLRSLTN